jgi:Protein of unknown function (DUF5672)
MDILKIFMREIFDTELPTQKIKDYLDTKSNSIKLGAILKDPKLISNLCFRAFFKNVVGVWPSRQCGSEFLQKTSVSGDLDLQEALVFLKSKIPLFNYINVDIDSLTKAKNMYLQDLRDVQKIKEALAIKFVHRYGVDQDVINPQDTLLNVFKNCIFNPVAYDRIKKINTELAKQTNKVPLDIPETPESMTNYYKISNDIIEHYELTQLNIFTNYINPFITIEPNNTIFDTINYVSLSDSSFVRHLLGSISIYWESGDMMKNDRFDILVKAANDKDGKNIVIFKSTTIKRDVSTVNDTTNIVYNVQDPYLMHFVPKLTSNYILVSEYLYPPTTVISSKTENSIYLSLYSNQSQTSYKNTMLLMNMVPFNRYLTYQDNYTIVKAIINEKVVYSLIDKDDLGISILNNKDFPEHQWNAHISLICPYSAIHAPNIYHPKFNVLLYDQFLAKYIQQNKDKLQYENLNVNSNAKNVVIMVDNRPNIFSVISVYITLSNLKQGEWDCCIVCNNDNLDFFKQFFKNKVTYITKFPYPTKKFTIETYNNLLKDPLFWNSFSKYDRALFIQDDGMIIKPGMEEMFFKYDYVGAPWERKWATQNPNKFIKEEINPELVGNGGVSLRNIKSMKMICEKYRHHSKQLHYDKLQQQPEDVFFSYCCVQEKLLLPSYEEAQKFSSEQVCNNNAFGFHKTWVYHELPTIEAFFNSYV